MNSSSEKQKYNQIVSKVQSDGILNLEEFLQCVEFLVSEKQLITLKNLISRQKKLIIKLISPGIQPCKDQNIQIKIKHQRKLKSLPQFIYEHISETFYSLVEAIIDEDNQLIRAETVQILESLRTYKQEGDYSGYKKYVEYVLEQNFLPKHITDKITERNNKMIQNSKGEPSQAPKLISYEAQQKMTQEFISGKLANFMASFSEQEKQWRENIHKNPMLKFFGQDNEQKGFNSKEAVLIALQSAKYSVI